METLCRIMFGSPRKVAFPLQGSYIDRFPLVQFAVIWLFGPVLYVVVYGCTVWDSCCYSNAFSVAHSTEGCHGLRRFWAYVVWAVPRGTTGHFLVHNLPKTTAGFLDKLDNWADLSFFTPIDSAQTYPTMVIESSNYRGVIQAPAAALDNSKICFEASDGSPLPKALGWISLRREPMSFMSLSPGFILRSGYVVVKSL